MKLKKISKYTLIIFMMLEPLLDLSILYSNQVIDIFKFSPATIIRIIFLIVLGIFAIILFKDKKKYKTPFIIFISIYLLYSIFHLYNGYLFTSDLKSYGNYSIFSEAFYLIRMFCPIMLTFITYQNDLEYKDIKRIIIIVYLIFSSIMVITNLFGVALTSYHLDSRDTIIGNIFYWFKKDIYQVYTYEYFASKGLFSYANPLSATLVSMLPILVYIVLNDKFNVTSLITLFLSMLAMAMLGTRIAGLGMLMVYVFSIILYCIFNLRKKKITPNFLVCIIFLILFIALYKYMPVANRTYTDSSKETVEERIKESGADKELEKLKIELKTMDKDESKEKKIEYLKKYYAIYDLGPYFYDMMYSYQEDTDFWFNMLDVPYQERNDNREIKTYINKRVFELNDNKLDYLLGFSYERPMNAECYMENDIIAQFYSLGIFGVLLFVFPYFFLVCYIIYKIFKEKKFDYLNITYIISIGLIYFIAILSGNVFDFWIVTLFLGFILGLLLRNIKEKV